VRQQQGECPPGHAVITLAGNLPAKAVIHAVGPVWHGGDQHEASILEEAYRNCLRLAADNGYKTMAFPAISTGVYGYPKAAATIAVETVYRYLSLKPMPEKVIFVCFDEDTTSLSAASDPARARTGDLKQTRRTECAALFMLFVCGFPEKRKRRSGIRRWIS
jgi:O-acetyl-ADP-ribose deacetylase (regulator of RNase III)